jgi:RNA polymerase sigma-70 factor (ECF subfamily)
MAEASHDSRQLQVWIDRLQSGDLAAREGLLEHACERLRRLTRHMLRGYARLHLWEETDDVLNNALLRLWGALQQVVPTSIREFYGLASLQIRRELIDLARRYFGPEGVAANQAGPGQGGSADTPLAAALEKADTTHEPSRLAVWSEFHQHVEALPPEEREVFDLIWYQGIPQGEAAALLGLSERTLKRRWWSARQRLHQALEGRLPEP